MPGKVCGAIPALLRTTCTQGRRLRTQEDKSSAEGGADATWDMEEEYTDGDEGMSTAGAAGQMSEEDKAAASFVRFKVFEALALLLRQVRDAALAAHECKYEGCAKFFSDAVVNADDAELLAALGVEVGFVTDMSEDTSELEIFSRPPAAPGRAEQAVTAGAASTTLPSSADAPPQASAVPDASPQAEARILLLARAIQSGDASSQSVSRVSRLLQTLQLDELVDRSIVNLLLLCFAPYKRLPPEELLMSLVRPALDLMGHWHWCPSGVVQEVQALTQCGAVRNWRTAVPARHRSSHRVPQGNPHFLCTE